MDFGFRLLAAGGRVRHDPGWIASETTESEIEISQVDEFVFILRHIGRFHAVWSAFWSPVLGRNPFKSWHAFLQAYRKVKRIPPPFARMDGHSLNLMDSESRQRVSSITAVVPTLNRYDYISKSIQSLLLQKPPPDEIIVVDQSDGDRLRPDVYEPFEGAGLRVIYMSVRGQSTSRNEAIRQARGEWCLLWEDDTEAWPEMLAEHVRAVEQSGADASTGVSLAPWKDETYIPPHKRHPQLADVLATGNCLVRKSALFDVGGLDVAFNRGSGADHDLGARLYLSGREIVFTPTAIETHHKAASGGMRTYGAWWRNRTAFTAAYPPPTQIYTIRRYYEKPYWLPLYLLYFWTASKQHRATELIWLWLTAPIKLWTATRAADQMETQLGLAPASATKQ